MARGSYHRPRHKGPTRRRRVQACKWLRRDLATCAVCYTLCLNEKAFWRELKRLGVKADVPFLSSTHANATTNFLWTDKEKRVAIVTMRHKPKDRTIEQTNALLVHEAVHIWQEHCDLIGEKRPSDEYMAYGIQLISQELMISYREQTARR